MTSEEKARLLALPPCRELDAAVATYVMRWANVRESGVNQGDGLDGWVWQEPKGWKSIRPGQDRPLNCFSDGQSFFWLHAKCLERWGWVNISSSHENNSLVAHQVSLWGKSPYEPAACPQVPSGLSTPLGHFFGVFRGDSLPHALCRAALAAALEEL